MTSLFRFPEVWEGATDIAGGTGNDAEGGDHFQLKKTKKRRRVADEVATKEGASDVSTVRVVPRNELMDTYHDAPEKIRDLYSNIV